MTAAAPLPAISAQALDQAIDWLVRLHAGADTAPVQIACAQWRAADPQHEAAWQALQTTEACFRSLPPINPGAARAVLEQVGQQRLDRRQALKLLSVIAIAGGAGWLGAQQLPWQRWRADYATTIGERRNLLLADGTRLQLDTGTAVDVQFDEQRRLLSLQQGQIHIDSAGQFDRPQDPRPFWVVTHEALLLAPAAQFAVRQNAGHSSLRVSAGEVVIQQPRQSAVRVEAGQEFLIEKRGARRIAHNPLDASAWARGQLVVRQIRLGQLLQELSRYRRGWLRCDPVVAGLRVSGVFQLDDIDQVLTALSATLPVRIQRTTPFWTHVLPA